MPRDTIEQLAKRREALREKAAKRRQEMKRLTRHIERERVQLEIERYTALGRTVERALGVTTAAEFEEWMRLTMDDGEVRFAP